MIVQSGGIDLILSAMKLHSSNSTVQAFGCHTLSLLSKDPNFSGKFKALNGEAVIREALNKFPNCRGKAQILVGEGRKTLGGKTRGSGREK